MFIKKSVVSKLCVILVICFCVTGVSANDLSSEAQKQISSEKLQGAEISENGSDISKLKLENIPQALYENSNLNKETGSKKKAVDIDSVDAESLTSYTTVNEDGSKTLYAYDTPIKYIDKDTNEIKFIDNTMEKTSFLKSIFSPVEYTNKSNDIEIALPDKIASGITVKSESNEIKMTPVIKENSTPEKIDFSFLGETQTVVEYKNAFGEGQNLQYSAINTGLKENIFVEKYNGNNEYQFEIEAAGLVPESNEGPSITFLDEETKEPVYYINQPWARDSYIEEGEDDGHHLENNNYYRIEKTEDDKYLLTMVINKEFLESAETVYPVLIDPTIICGRSNIVDCTVFSSSSTWSTAEYLQIGYRSGYGESMAYIKLMNVKYLFKHINADNLSNSDVTYCTKQTYGGSSSYAIKCYDSNTYTSTSSATYSTINSNVGTLLDTTVCGANGVYGFWVGNSFKKWLKYELGETGKSCNYGIILKADQTGRAYKQFASRLNDSVDYQHFQINYNEDTSIADGVYHITNMYSGKLLDHVEGDNRVNQWQADGLPNQQWLVTRNTNGTYRLSPMTDQNLALEVFYNIEEDEHPVTVYNYAPDTRDWRIIRNEDGSYRLMPCVSTMRALNIYYGSEKTAVYNGTTFPKRPGIDAEIYTYTGSENQQWTFEDVDFGNGGSYRAVNTSYPNCFGYSLFKNTDVVITFYPYDTSHLTEYYSSRFESKIEEYAYSCRRIDSYTSPIASNEYRIAIRAPYNDDYRYHVIYQLSDGTWAGKDGYNYSQHFGWGNPSISPEMWSNDNYPASCGTIYFAVIL